MQVFQKLTILFYRKNKKRDKEGFVPIYCRISITEAGYDEFSTGIKIPFDAWDLENHIVFESYSLAAKLNKRLRQIETDLERHFDLTVAQNGQVNPKMVKASYQQISPEIAAKKEKLRKDQMAEAAVFSHDLDELAKRCTQFLYQWETLDNMTVGMERKKAILLASKQNLLEELSILVKRGRAIFDDKDRIKTLVSAMDDYLLNYLELAMAGNLSVNTIKKRRGAKGRVLEFLHERYSREDLLLAALDTRFIKEFVKREQTAFHNGHNTIWKYVQILKEILDRAVDNEWIAKNPFASFQWSYIEPEQKEWPSMEEMIYLIGFDLQDEQLTVIKDVFIYQSFAGPSYSELFRLKETHLVRGVDGKIWANQNRRKTASKETLPLLPICLDIIEKYRSHPRCVKTGKVLPVPTNQHYNRALKKIGELTGIASLTNCHQARYFFANEVAHENENDLKIIGLMMGQRNPKSIHTYIKPGKKRISRSMAKIEKALYQEGGVLAPPAPSTGGAKVINLDIKTAGHY